MYTSVLALGPTDTAEYSVRNYEAQRQRDLALSVEQQDATNTEPERDRNRGWFQRLIPALQR